MHEIRLHSTVARYILLRHREWIWKTCKKLSMTYLTTDLVCRDGEECTGYKVSVSLLSGYGVPDLRQVPA